MTIGKWMFYDVLSSSGIVSYLLTPRMLIYVTRFAQSKIAGLTACMGIRWEQGLVF
jgi:hypothetical protein